MQYLKNQVFEGSNIISFNLKTKTEMLKFEMEQNYYNEMDKLKNENEMEMRTIRAEMDRTLEIGRQK